MPSMRRTSLRFLYGTRCFCKAITNLFYFLATLSCVIVVCYMLVCLKGPDFERRTKLSSTEDRILSKIDFTVDIKTSQVIAVVDERFLSVCLTWTYREPWTFSSTREKRLIALTKALSPAYLRVGGIPSDFVVFQYSREEKSRPFGTLTTHVSENDLDRINEIADNAGWQVLFTLSVMKRRRDGSWDPSNPYEIVTYVAEKGYKFGWELGNESNHLKPYNVTISPEQLAEDFKTLKQHLARFPTVEQFLVGPDVSQPRGNAMEYLRRFLEKGHSYINAVTWHHYYVTALDSFLAQYYVPEVLDTLIRDIEIVDEVISKIVPGIPLWLGETASSSGGGTEEISNRFVSGFTWMDKLGVAAQQGYKVIMRQALFNGRYSLLDHSLEPNPDYWISVLHKKLFGTNVLMVKRHHSSSTMVRVYAHCTSTKYEYYKEGAVSIMAMNVHPDREAHLHMGKFFQGLEIHEYLLTPAENLASRRMKLNNKLLEMNTDSLPVLEPRRVQPGDQLILPPLTYAFYVVPGARTRACRFKR